MGIAEDNYLENVAQMYVEYKKYSDATDGDAEKKALSWAAYYADCVISGAQLFDRHEGDLPVPLKAGGVVPLHKAESVAWEILKRRAAQWPSNKIYDSGARWFYSASNGGF
jgi:hypothetical protein